MPLADSIKKLLSKMVYVQCIRKLLRFLFYFRVLVNINELIGSFLWLLAVHIWLQLESIEFLLSC